MLTLNRASFSVLALFALLAALVYLPAAPPLHPIPDRDGGVFLYIADQMLHGAVPYRDVWDHKPPGAYLLPLLGLAMSPESLWGPWVLACLLLSAAAYSGYTILRRYIATPLSLSITCIWLLELTSFVRRDPFLTETTALPFQIGSFGLAVWLAQHPPWNRARWGWLALLLVGVLPPAYCSNHR